MSDRWRQHLADSIRAAGEQFNFQLIAFVFMPEHVHLLTLPLDAEPAIAGYLAAVKRPTSTLVKKDLQLGRSRLLEELTIRERPGKTTFRFGAGRAGVRPQPVWRVDCPKGDRLHPCQPGATWA
jgi:putative transposase